MVKVIKDQESNSNMELDSNAGETRLVKGMYPPYYPISSKYKQLAF